MSLRLYHNQTQVEQFDPLNRGLAYGDGLFETMRIDQGSVPWLQEHLHRLRNGAQRLGLAVPRTEYLQQQINAVVGDLASGVLKLVIYRAGPGRSYSYSPHAGIDWLLSAGPLPQTAQSLNLLWCKTQLSEQPVLAGLKHLNRLEQVLARHEVDEQAADEGLLCDIAGRVICATAANIFVYSNNQWITPALDSAGVAGVCRAWFLRNALAQEVPVLSREMLLSAEAIFLCNAVRGMLAVSRLDQSVFSASSAYDKLYQRFITDNPMFAHKD